MLHLNLLFVYIMCPAAVSHPGCGLLRIGRRIRYSPRQTFGGIDHENWLKILNRRPHSVQFRDVNKLATMLEERFTSNLQEKVDLFFSLSKTFGIESSF